MLRIIKKIDVIIVIIFFTILVGIAVVTMRSETYTIGYEIAHLKTKERNLRQRQTELLSELAFAERTIRDRLLSQTTPDGKQKYILPDRNHVLKETTSSTKGKN
jgi:cell division protein FtsL